jgi:methyl-accepting chemotaxis protein
MKNLKIWQKLALMAVVFIVPFAVVTYAMISSVNTLSIEFARQEIRGLEYHRPLAVLLKDLQQRRTMSSSWLAGDAAFGDKVAASTAAIENDLRAVAEVDQRLDPTLHTTTKWVALNAACRALLAKTSGWTAEENFEQHTRVIAEVIALITHVGDVSNLTLDPDIDSYYLMNVVIFQGPELSEILGQVRGLGSRIAASGKVTPDQADRVERLSALAGFLRDKTGESFGKAFEFNATLQPRLQEPAQSAATAVQEALQAAEGLTAGSRQRTDAAAYHASMTRAVDAVFDLQSQAALALDELLDKRIDKVQREVHMTLLWAVLGLLVVLLVAVIISRDITRHLAQVVSVANQIASGDIAVASDRESRRDEIGTLRLAFEGMAASLRQMVQSASRISQGDLTVAVKPQSERDALGNALSGMVTNLAALVSEVQKSGIQVNASVNTIAATTKEQQATASEIAATTTEIGATSKEISATSRELVRTLKEVSAFAEQSATLAGSGQTGLTQMEETMRHVMEAAAAINAKLAVLNEKAGNINQVVTTITKVADQTNLLSLNASIEAEKAGEYGKGFSVVATEIRRLADQTAVATYDIEQMVKEIQSAVSAGVMGMDKFSDEVRRGMQEVQQVGGQLSQIIQQVQALAPRVESVNEGMQAQATGAEQITQALGQLSEASQQTVESLRQSALAIEGLNEVSGALRSGISRFKLA